MTNTEIINEGKKNGKTNAEINAELVAAGYTPYFGEKTGNGKLYFGVGSPEPCTVENGKLTSIKAVPHQDIVEIDGEQYHVDDDGVTLIAMPAPEDPWWFNDNYKAWGMEHWQDELDKYIPDKDMMDRPAYAGKTVIKGALRYRYDETGKAHYEPKSMAEYDKDHGRNQ